jgi:hypothetical protein
VCRIWSELLSSQFVFGGLVFLDPRLCRETLALWAFAEAQSKRHDGAEYARRTRGGALDATPCCGARARPACTHRSATHRTIAMLAARRPARYRTIAMRADRSDSPGHSIRIR